MPDDPDFSDPEAVYRHLNGEIADLSVALRTQFALVNRDNERAIAALEDRVALLETNKRFVLHAAKGAGTADAILNRILEKLETIQPYMMLQQLRALGVTKTGMADAIQLGVERSLLVRGVLLQPRKGQRPQVIALTSLDPRPTTGPPPDHARILWEDDADTGIPASPERPSAPPKRPPLTVVLNPDTGRYGLTAP